MSRWIRFLIAIAAGLGLGLLYGWVINPIEYVDTTPGTLKADYKADYVLMVAESYWKDGDLPAAARRLALLQEMPLSDLVYKALLFGQKAGYGDQDLALLQELRQALISYDLPDDAVTPPSVDLPSGAGTVPATPSRQGTAAP